MAEIDRKFSVIEDPKLRVKLSSIEKQRYANATGFDMGKIERRLSEYSKKHLKRDFFPWGLYFSEVFSEKGGFDIVLGNPPYIGEKGHKELFQPVKNANLGKYYLGKMDYFYFFFHLALNLARTKGLIAFITTNYYPTATGVEIT